MENRENSEQPRSSSDDDDDLESRRSQARSRDGAGDVVRSYIRLTWSALVYIIEKREGRASHCTRDFFSRSSSFSRERPRMCVRGIPFFFSSRII